MEFPKALIPKRRFISCQEYEREKARIVAKDLPPKEYEEAIRDLSKKLRF